MKFSPSHPTLSVTPTPPTDPPPAPPPLNLPPSRARRQLAARLALHSQQKADLAEEDANGVNEALEHEQSISPSFNHDDDGSDSSEDAPLQFGEPLHHTPKINVDQGDANDEHEVEKGIPAVIPAVHRQLDLDDFANSPAADADDRASSEEEALEGEEGHDVEMKVVMG